MIKQQISSLLEKEMDRTDFLKHVGVAAITLIGIPVIIKTLSTVGTSTVQPSKSSGYGSSAYGGAPLK